MLMMFKKMMVTSIIKKLFVSVPNILTFKEHVYSDAETSQWLGK
jgi:hypothetical protein